MGWWNADREGNSLLMEPTGYAWGDSPADLMDDAIINIRRLFRTTLNREPTIGELRAGLEFSLLGLPDEASAEELGLIE